MERVERRCACVEAVVAPARPLARCTEMKSRCQVVENQPTKTCLDAVKAAREAAAVRSCGKASLEARRGRSVTAGTEKALSVGSCFPPKDNFEDDSGRGHAS